MSENNFGYEKMVEINIPLFFRTKRIYLPGIGMIQTRVVQEQHYEGGELIELSKNYFAICEPTNDLFYFGEAVNIYHPDGTITHDGSWQAGTLDASGLAEPGIAMPGTFLLGSRYFQEIAEGQAMDRAEHTEMGVEIATEAGTFTGCVKTRETTPLDPGAVSLKTFCPGIGLVKDGPVELVDYGFDIDDDLTGAKLK